MKKDNIDIIIRYEHKVRELESIMLIKMEMERRGYSVAFTANYDYKETNRYNPRLILSPAIYWEDTLRSDLAVYGLKKKVANLLWEQVFGIEEEESPSCHHNVVGAGQKVLTFCWGRRTQNRLVAAGMPIKNTKVVGQINTDLLRGPLASFLMTKEQLSSLFDLDVKARWNLFVSSFAYCELDDLQKELIYKVYGEKYLKEFTAISNESRRLLLQWFESILISHPDDIFIYRPHPDEARKSIQLKELEANYANFHVISDLAMKHWINASDKIYNWYSTGIVDAIILNKPYRLLRPCKIPKEYDYRLFYNAPQIRTFEDFEKDYPLMTQEDSSNIELFKEYYYLPDRYVYLEICDFLEEMLNSDKYDIHYSIKEMIKFGYPFIKRCIIRRFLWIKPILRKLPVINSYFKKTDAIRRILDEGFEKNVATQLEIEEVYRKLRPYVYGE